MAFDTLSDRLRLVANASLALCRTNFGSNGLQLEKEIDAAIGWKPTFYMRHRPLLVAVEVNDLIFPELLKIAAHDIEHFDYPIAIYQACSLDVYQADRGLKRVTDLRDHGFGLITVADNGAAQIQVRAGPLGQFIPNGKCEHELRTLTPSLKVRFRAAHATYETDVGQGLQAAGQIIEALIKCIAVQAEAAGLVNQNTSNRDAADIIDRLWDARPFHPHRAVLGGLRSFVRTYRNTASHPARTPQEAIEKIRNCKAGFLEALRLARELRAIIQALGYRVIIH